MTSIDPQRFLDLLREEIKTLSFEQQLAFGTITSEHHLSDCVAFSNQFQWGDANLLREVINTAWAIVGGKFPPSPTELNALLRRCVDSTPDTDDFQTVLADYAQDAAVMVCHLVKFIAEQSPESVVSIASRARDLIDARVQFHRKLNPSDPSLEAKIAEDPMMREELQMLEKTLELVRKALSREALVQLRARRE